MRTVYRRVAWRAALAVLALASTSALAAVATATPAQARCDGVNDPVTMVLRDPNPGPNQNPTIAREIPDGGTCNGNDHYQGFVEDSRTDGSCARLAIYDSAAGGFVDDVTECETLGQTYFSRTHSDGLMYFQLEGDGFFVPRNNFGY